jgi:uncharacterized membrane protein
VQDENLLWLDASLFFLAALLSHIILLLLLIFFLILIYNSNLMHKSQSLFYLTTALHVSVVTVTHLQEHKTTVTTASGNRHTALLSAAVVEQWIAAVGIIY